MRNKLFHTRWTFFRLSLILILGLVFPSCTTTTITPQIVHAPARDYEKAVVGEIDAADELWEARLPYLRRALVGTLREDNKFTEVIDPAPDTIPMDAIVISGRVTEIDKGDKALRFIIGFGAGRAKAAGLFSIHDAHGTLLAQFESRKAYSGGAGIGGFDMLDMEEMMEKLGEETAQSIIRWANGGPLEPPKNN